MTTQQLSTLDMLEAHAKETGAKLDFDEFDIYPDGGFYVVEMRGADWDNEQIAWYLYRTGELELI